MQLIPVTGKLFRVLCLCCLLMGYTAAVKAQWYDVTRYGAVGDSTTDNTKAIQKAIDACAVTGGKVYFPAGKYLSATIYLKSNVTLHIAAGATILGHTDTKQYPYQDAGIRFYGDEWARQSLVFCKDQQNVGIEGSGTIDGQGAAFVITTSKKPDRYRNRPYLLWFVNCKNVKVRNVTLRNSAFWMQHYLGCEFVWIEGLHIWNHSNKNNDMMDIDGCRNVHISGITGDSDDDGITVKSTSPRITENVTISDCIISSHCNALKLGTESTGGFRNIVVSNCVIKPSAQLTTIYGKPAGNSGISLEMVDGGIMENITINNIVINGPQVPLFIRLGNRARPYMQGAPAPPPGRARNIHLSDITATGADETGCSISGIAKAPLENVSLEHIYIETKAAANVSLHAPVVEKETEYPEATMFGSLPAYGFFIRYVKDVRLSDITLRSPAAETRPGIVVHNTTQFTLNGLDIQTSAATPAAMYISNSNNGVITNSRNAYPVKRRLLQDDASANIKADATAQ
ncbi:MAG TPA: glycosyl hydrolase family 28 protein [Chitinophaga sp.]|uniref:glycoside hydrolase family 28 protein n=1 Tax=Chitinophaga sp. TaxID=1869181 RepID=UPI002DB9E3B3|nr:glycosyl hydrolase family 28 protein [Chitinophaga sp.]HEU4554788.1 glycosyl hydrolase family 28 protein [Chitinophaga sp.]